MDECNQLGNIYEDSFNPNQLTELAIDNFNLSYNIVDVRTKYLSLMTCLESLFNTSTNQISHTVSRHLALIISKNIDEFNNNYRRIKELYGIRNRIVHGGTVSEDISKATDDLQEKARIAINDCLKTNLNKLQLFEKFNVMGY